MTKRGLSWRWALDCLAGVGAGDWYGIVDGLVICGRGVLRDVLGGWRGLASRLYGGEAGLLHLGCGRWSLSGRGLQLEVGRRRLGKLRLRLDDSATRGEGALLDIAEIAVGSGRMTGRHGIVAEGRGLGSSKARSVGCGLTPELGEVHIGSGAVSQVHGLGKAALGVVAVEDDTVQNNADDLDNDLDDDANQGPVLQTTDEAVVNLVLVDL